MCVYVSISYFLFISVDGYLAYPHVLAIVNNATMNWFQIEKGVSTSRLYIVTVFISLICRVHHVEYWTEILAG